MNGQPILGGYELVSKNSTGYSNKNPRTEGWYEYQNGTFVASTDTTVNANKVYYKTGTSVALYDQTYIDGLETNLNQRIDGAVETFTGTVVPTLVTYPAVDWTSAQMASHVGDIYYVVNSAISEDGYCYRFAYDNSTSSYKWILIKDSDVTKALSDIDDLQDFESSTTSWIDDTDEGLRIIRENHTSLSGVVNKTVKSSIQLWFTKANTTAPTAPTTEITSTSTSGNGWRTVVPVYNASYPYYYYCWQYKFVDNTCGWSAVIYDQATTEAEERARTGVANAATADGKAVNAQNTANDNIKSSVMLWFTKANDTAPSKPTAVVTTSNASTANAWNLLVPTYNSSYPYYFYCYQQQKGDGSYQWSNVIYDRATTETQSTSRATSSALANYVSTNDAAIQALQSQVDGQLEIWYGTVTPTTSNTPASNWSTSTDKDNHIGDLYYDTTNGKVYQWTKSGSTYSWTEIPDSSAAAALAAAQDAQATADGKRRVFTSQPTVPYDIGDLWVNGDEVKYATTKRATGSYTASDWAQTATDDTVANANIKSSIQLWRTKSSSTAISKPYTDGSTNHINSTSTAGDTWTTVVPVYNSSYPYYHYCYQQQRGDGKYQWTTPVYDDATSVAMKKAQEALSAADFTTFQSTTFKEVKDTVDEQSSTITTLSSRVDTKADSSTVTTLSNTVNSVSQTATSNSSTLSQLTQTLGTNADGTTKTDDIMHRMTATENDLDGFKTTVSSTYQTKSDMSNYSTTTQMNSAINQKANEISQSVSETYATQTSIPTKVSDLTNDSNFATQGYADGKASDAQAAAIADANKKLAGQFATSSTAKGTAAKVATITPAVTGWTLYTGASITVKFIYENTATTPTLNVNSTGAKTIKAYTGTAALTTDEYKWPAGATMSFVYDGTYWRIQDSTELIRLSSAESSITQTANSIVSLVANTDTYTKPDGTTATNTIKSAIKQNADNIALRVEKSGVISAINLTSETAKIQASKVEINGTAIFSAISSDVDDAITSKGYQTASQVSSTANAAASAVQSNLDAEINQRKATYAICETPGGTAAKDASCSNFALYTGVSIAVKFTNANTATTPTLNINSTGAKTIKSYTGGTLTAAEYKWAAGSIMTFTYDGSYWRMQDGGALQAKADAASSASAASTSASTASSKASEASTSATNAANSASTASSEATAAANSASTASSKASDASTSATNAASSASAASTSASTASSKATAAANSATAASTSATNAANSATAAAEVMGGFTILWNYSAFGTSDPGEGYICLLDPATGNRSDANGWVKWNGTKRTITKQMVNPNTIAPYNIPIYIVTRLNSSTATTGTNYIVWYDSGWKYATLPTPSAVGGSWTWNVDTDIILGKFVEPSSETALTDCEIYNPPLTAKHVTTDTVTARSANAAAAAAQSTANNAAPKSSAIARTQRIYWRAMTSSGKPSANTTWVATSGTGYGNWSLHVPQLTSGTSKYPFLYTAMQSQTVAQQAAGTACSCSDVLIDDTDTVIDGGNIITGTVNANAVNATSGTFDVANIPDLTADKITAGTINVSRIPDEALNSNVKIGGRNLFGYGSKCESLDGFTVSGNWEITTEDGFTCAHAAGALTTTKYIASKLPYCPKANETVTISAYVKIKNIVYGTTNPMCEFYLSGETINGTWRDSVLTAVYVDGLLTTIPDINKRRFTNYISDTNWHHIAFVNTWQDYAFTRNMSPTVYIRDVTGDLYIRDVKYERGNKATDWTPAPEDAQDSTFVQGTGTTAGLWKGTLNKSSLTNGMQITYWTNIAGASLQPNNTTVASNIQGGVPATVTSGFGGTWLNLTLSDGTETGWYPCFYGGTSRLTATYYGVNNAVRFIFKTGITMSINSTSYTVSGWWSDANYNANTVGIYGGQVTAGTNGIRPYGLIMKTAENQWSSLTTSAVTGTGTNKSRYTGGFLLGKIMYNSNNSTYNSGNSSGTCYDAYSIDFRYSTNCGTTLVKGKDVYIVGQVSSSDKLFRLNATWWTQTIPTSEDGNTYIYVGTAYSTYQVYLSADNTAYRFINGGFNAIDTVENFIRADSSGLMIYDGTSGQATSGSVQSNNLLITSTGTQVRNGQTVLASYGSNTKFYDGAGTAQSNIAAQIGADGLDIIKGSIGGWEINSDSISREISYGSFTSTVALDNTGLTFDDGEARIYANDSGDMFLEADAVQFYAGENSLTYMLLYDAGLHVVNDMTECQIRCISNAGWIYMYSQPTSSGNRGIYAFDGSSTYKAVIDITPNNLCYFRGAADSVSDLKKKDVITDYDWKIDEFINGLKPIAYRFKHDDGSLGDRIRMGFGAQDVRELTRSLYDEELSLYRARIIDETKEGTEREQPYHGEDIDDEKLSWSLTYEELIAPMVLEIQRLMARVDKLEADLKKYQNGSDI